MSGGEESQMRALNIEQLRVLRAGSLVAIGYVLLITAGYTYLDIFQYDSDALYGLASLVVWAAGYIMIVCLMLKSGHFPNGKKSGVGTYFVLGIATGIPILFGFVFLVVPGLYLILRWLPAFAYALATGPGAIEAMNESWRATSDFQGPLAKAMIGPIAMFCIAVAALLGAEFSENISWEAGSLIGNFALSIGTVWLTILGIAAFDVLMSPVAEIESPSTPA